MCRLRRTGFTLVEMLVVITIIGMLMGMLMPAIGAAREAARRAYCASNQVNIGKAMLMYEGAFTKFPGFINLPTSDTTALAYKHQTPTNVSPTTTAMYGASWAICLFPYLDGQALYDIWTMNSATLANTGLDPNADPFKNLKILVCPSNPPIYGSSSDTPLGYVVNGGYYEEGAGNYNITTQPACAYGVCHNLVSYSTTYGVSGNTPNLDPNNSQGISGSTFQSYMPYLRTRIVSLDYINSHDGAGTTLLLSETTHTVTDQRGWQRVDPAGLLFNWYCTTGLNPVENINTTNNLNKINSSIRTANTAGASPGYGPAAFHNGGVNAVFCDGHQYFLKDGISPLVYWHLMAPNDQGAVIARYLPAGIVGSFSSSDY